MATAKAAKKSTSANGTTNGAATAAPCASIDPDTEALASHAAEVLRLASDRTRLLILFSLANGNVSVNGLCEMLGHTQPAVSHHLALLRVGGIIEPNRDGKQIFYALTDRGKMVVEVAEMLGSQRDAE